MLPRMRIALCTCANLPAWEVDDAPFRLALREAGADVRLPVWNDPAVDWSAFDAALIRTTWDYQEQREHFVQWAVEAALRTRLFNPAPVVVWNTHKSYLRQLSEHGVPVAPTEWLQRGSRVDLASLLTARGWTRAFLKPCVGATARETLRFEAQGSGLARAEAHIARLLPHEDLMLQPYLSAVETRGEWSAVFFDGTLSHSVRKVPVPGDYRVQDDFGASDMLYHPAAGEIEVAHTVMAVLRDPAGPCPTADGTPLLYARADFLWTDRGDCVLTELELVEPSLFFRHAPAAAPRLCDALLRRLRA
jgi:hypothetical protein